jgi:hypothetical protein
MISDKYVNKSKITLAPPSTIGNERFMQRLGSYSRALSFFAKSNIMRNIIGFEPSKRFGVVRPQSSISLDWEPSVVHDKAVLHDLSQRYYTEDNNTPELPFPIANRLLRFSAINRNTLQQQQQQQLQKLGLQLRGGNHHPIPPPVLAVPYLSQKLFSNKTSVDTVIPAPKDISLHTGSFANSLTNSLGADAVTLGRNIFFARGKYNPKTPQGLALIVHELTHIKQLQKNTNLQKGDLGVTQRASLEKEALGNERKVLNYFMGYSYSLINSRYKLPPYPLQSNTNRMIMSDRPLNKMSENLIPSYETRNDVAMGNLLNSLPFLASNLKMKNNGNNSEDPANQTGGYNSVISRSSKNASLNSVESSNSVDLKYAAHPNKGSAPKAAILPLLAENTRSLDTTPVRSTHTQLPMPSLPPSIPTTTTQPPDLQRLADQVYDLIEQKIKMQRDKRGFR